MMSFFKLIHITCIFLIKQVNVSRYSRVADHCTQYSLSDSTDQTFKSTCAHDHDLLCQRCQDLKDVLSDINMAIQNSELKMSMTKKMLFTPFKRPSERFISGSHTSCDLWIKMPHVPISSIVSTRIASYLSKTGP